MDKLGNVGKLGFSFLKDQIQNRKEISKEYKQFSKAIKSGQQIDKSQFANLKGRVSDDKETTKFHQKLFGSKITKLALFLSPNPAKARAKFVQAKVKQELKPEMKTVGQNRSLAETLIKDGIKDGKSGAEIKQALTDQGITKKSVQQNAITVADKVAAKTTEWGGEVQDTKTPTALKEDLAFLKKLVNSDDPAATFKADVLDSNIKKSGLGI